MGLREQKRSSTRVAIEQAAWALAAHRPWADITVEEIAAAAGVSRRTFFNYFTSKDELLPASGLRPGALADAVRARPSTETSTEVLRTALLSVLEGNSAENLERMRAIWREPTLMEARMAGRRQLESELAGELTRRNSELSPAEALLTVALFLTGARIAFQSWVDAEDPGELVDTVKATLDLMSPSPLG